MTTAPVDTTAYPIRSLWTTVLHFLAWTDPALTVEEARKDIIELSKLTSSSSSPAVRESLGYPNYADVYSVYNETDEYARKIFGPNYPRLQEIKAKYDPDMIWNRWFAIRPATPQ